MSHKKESIHNNSFKLLNHNNQLVNPNLSMDFNSKTFLNNLLALFKVNSLLKFHNKLRTWTIYNKISNK